MHRRVAAPARSRSTCAGWRPPQARPSPNAAADAARRAARRLHTPLGLVRRRLADRGDGRRRPATLGHEYLVAHRSLAAADGRQRADRRAAGASSSTSSPSRRTSRAARRSGSSPASRSTSSTTARSTRTDELLARLDVVVASVHSKLRMPADEMTPRMVRRDRQPAHRRPRPLHRPAGHRRPRYPAGVGVRRRDRVRGLRAVRRRGRDQLAAGAARSAQAAARGWPSRRAASSRSTPTRTPRASSTGSPTAASGPRPAASSRPDRQHLAGPAPAGLDAGSCAAGAERTPALGSIHVSRRPGRTAGRGPVPNAAARDDHPALLFLRRALRPGQHRVRAAGHLRRAPSRTRRRLRGAPTQRSRHRVAAHHRCATPRARARARSHRHPGRRPRQRGHRTR